MGDKAKLAESRRKARAGQEDGPPPRERQGLVAFGLAAAAVLACTAYYFAIGTTPVGTAPGGLVPSKVGNALALGAILGMGP